MQKLSLLRDFEFGQFDHCFHYNQDIKLVPDFGGFILVYREKEIARGLSEQEALKMIEEHLEEIEYIKYDHILGDYLLDKEEEK
jgi:hypothetical protein